MEHSPPPKKTAMTPLHFAAATGNAEAVRLLLKHGALPAPPFFADFAGGSYVPLHYAAASGDAETVRLLLEAGAKPNVMERDSGYTPLHCAAYGEDDPDKNCVGAVKLLLEAGAKPNVNERGRGNAPLHYAAASGDAETVKLLLEAGAKPNDRNKEGSTPLHLAAESGNTETVNLLLEARAETGATVMSYVEPIGR